MAYVHINTCSFLLKDRINVLARFFSKFLEKAAQVCSAVLRPSRTDWNGNLWLVKVPPEGTGGPLQKTDDPLSWVITYRGSKLEKQQGFWATITTWTLVPFVLYYMQGTDSTLSRWLLRKRWGGQKRINQIHPDMQTFFPPFDQNTLFPLTKHGCFRWLPHDDPGSVGSFFLLKGSSTAVPSLISCTSRMVISL